ncbi:MAG: SRPBCC family protein [Candidatus Dormibacteraceae bacterium]
MTQQTVEDRYGKLHTEDGRAIVRYTRQLEHSRDAVWQALSEDEHLAAWFPTTIDGERAPGAALTFRFTDLDVPPMTGTIRSFDPPSVLEFTWGDDILRFELKPDGNTQTVLTLTVTMPEFGKAARDAAGWHMCLDNLAAELAGDRDHAEHGDPWREVNKVYIAQFGPEASTIGPPEAWKDKNGDA